MSKSKNAIAEIKKLMVQFGFMSDEVSLKSFKLEDNTILEAADLKVGEAVTRLSEEFERVALEDGSYRLVENFNIDVVDGKIVAVKEIFVDAVLEDGTKIKIEGEEVVEGAKVVVVTEEGSIPAPDGVHIVSDGSKVETKDGVIVAISAPEGMEDSAVVEDEVEDEINVDEEMYQMLKDMLMKISDKMKKMEEKMEKVEAEFSAFKKAPAAKPIPNGKTEFSRYNEEDSRVKGILQLRNNI
jgi:propanediol utilization protein